MQPEVGVFAPDALQHCWCGKCNIGFHLQSVGILVRRVPPDCSSRLVLCAASTFLDMNLFFLHTSQPVSTVLIFFSSRLHLAVDGMPLGATYPTILLFSIGIATLIYFAASKMFGHDPREPPLAPQSIPIVGHMVGLSRSKFNYYVDLRHDCPLLKRIHS